MALTLPPAPMVTPARCGVRVEASWGTRRQGGWSRERGRGRELSPQARDRYPSFSIVFSRWPLGRGCVARAVFYIAAFAVLGAQNFRAPSFSFASLQASLARSRGLPLLAWDLLRAPGRDQRPTPSLKPKPKPGRTSLARSKAAPGRSIFQS